MAAGQIPLAVQFPSSRLHSSPGSAKVLANCLEASSRPPTSEYNSAVFPAFSSSDFALMPSLICRNCLSDDLQQWFSPTNTDLAYSGAHPNAVQNNLNASPYGSPPSTTPHLNGASARSIDGVQRPVAVNTQSLSRPPSDGGVGIGSPPRIPGMLPAGGGAIPRTASADIPSQPQPQLTSTASLLQAAAASAANPLGVLPGVAGDLLNLKPVNEPISLATGAPFSAGNGMYAATARDFGTYIYAPFRLSMWLLKRREDPKFVLFLAYRSPLVVLSISV